MKSSQPPAPEETKKCYSCKVVFPESNLARMRVQAPGHTKHVIRHYCKKCFSDKFSTCKTCGAPIEWKGEYKVLPSGDVICNACSQQYTTCHHCEDIVPANMARRIEGQQYCQICLDRYFVRCVGCGDIVKRSEAREIYGDMYCEDCYRANEDDDDDDDDRQNEQWDDVVPLYDANKAIKTEDVARAFPDMESRLARIFDRSAWNRSITAREAMKTMHEILPGVTFNDDFTYINPIGATKPLNDLKSPKNSTYKVLSPEHKILLVHAIDAISNVKHDLGALENDKKVATMEMKKAIKVRMYQEQRDKQLSDATNSIVGKYPYPDACHPKLMFIITKDPVAIIAKSTSQCWEGMSCEKIVRGEYGQGGFSDIANSNAVCYIFDKEIPIARIMLRWCHAEKNRIDIGIEAKWYYCTLHPKHAHSFNMGTSTTKESKEPFLGKKITARQATDYLVAILQSKGFYIYEKCSTPYAYMGYSDTDGGKTHIHYHGDK